MIHPEDQARLDEAKREMETATGDQLAKAVQRYRILENKAIRRALTDLDVLLSKSPVKSANRMLAFRHIEDASMRLGKDLQECAEPNPYPNSRDTSNATVDPTAAEVTKSTLPPHQARVVEEKAQLDDRLKKLDAFIQHSTIYRALPEEERGRLVKQALLMAEYKAVLVQRILAFNSETPRPAA